MTYQQAVRELLVGGMHIHAGFGDGAARPGDDGHAPLPAPASRALGILAPSAAGGRPGSNPTV